jgi:hypothetical protein
MVNGRSGHSDVAYLATKSSNPAGPYCRQWGNPGNAAAFLANKAAANVNVLTVRALVGNFDTEPRLTSIRKFRANAESVSQNSLLAASHNGRVNVSGSRIEHG